METVNFRFQFIVEHRLECRHLRIHNDNACLLYTSYNSRQLFMVTYQDKFPYSLPAGNAAHAKQSQQLRLQYLGSLSYQGHIKSLQTEQFGLARQCSNCRLYTSSYRSLYGQGYTPHVCTF